MIATIQTQGALWGDLAWIIGGGVALVFMVWHASQGFARMQTALALMTQRMEASTELLSSKVDLLAQAVGRLQTIVDGQLELMAEDRARHAETMGLLDRKVDAMHGRQDALDRRVALLEGRPSSRP